ncbi:UNVERIFIED_CONTAM: hypothetical protein H355_008571 [Colinus virginianus]|nr:hypothetical protein H355_008571 [Colinus virginianus]
MLVLLSLLSAIATRSVLSVFDAPSYQSDDHVHAYAFICGVYEFHRQSHFGLTRCNVLWLRRCYTDEDMRIHIIHGAGLHPLEIVTEVKKRHAQGDTAAGINVRHACVSSMLEANILQPLLVSSSAVKLATEAVMMILKIDDIVLCR